MPVFTILNNIWLGLRVHYLFPQYKPEGHISNEDHKNIRKLVAGTFVQQACAITRNSLDSVCISAFLGLTMTAIYNNYYLILNGVTVFLAIFTAAFAGGVGNHVATRSVRDNFEEMKKLDFVYLWCSGWCTICMLCLYQPFMILWMGRDMLLSFSAVLLLCIYFYILKLGDIKSMYNSARGLWWEQRYRAIIETMLNLILNIILGKFLGVPGIILATIISLFLCNYVWSTRIIFDLYFSISRMKEYYKYQFKQSFLILIVAVVNYLICISIQVEEVLTQLIIRMVICFILPNLMFFLMYRREDSFSYLRKVLCKQEST